MADDKVRELARRSGDGDPQAALELLVEVSRAIGSAKVYKVMRAFRADGLPACLGTHLTYAGALEAAGKVVVDEFLPALRELEGTDDHALPKIGAPPGAFEAATLSGDWAGVLELWREHGLDDRTAFVTESEIKIP